MFFTALFPFKKLGRLVSLFTLERALGLGRDACKRLRLMHGEISKHFAIKLDAGQFQTMHKLRIIQTIEACGSSNANNPQAAKIALLQFSSGISKIQPSLHSLFSGAVQFRFCAAITLRQF